MKHLPAIAALTTTALTGASCASCAEDATFCSDEGPLGGKIVS